jgi:4-amino-4-deoxy-L-arabinose transferase-like glycosyltransferase
MVMLILQISPVYAKKGAKMNKKINDMISSFKAQPVLKKIYLILVLLLTASIIVSATLFIVSCSTIYFTGGESPFSREVVNRELSRILPANLITLALLIGAGVLSLFVDHGKPKRYPLAKKLLLKVHDEESETLLLTLEKEKSRRRKVRIIALSACTVIAAVALVFVLTNPYTLENVNTDIAYSVIIAAVATLLGFAVWYARGVIIDASYSRALEAVREDIRATAIGARASKRSASPKDAAEDDKISSLSLRDGHAYMFVRLGVLLVSIAFIILGIFNGGMSDVLGKAVRICTECIGLG